MDRALLAAYDKPVPRYTSYPTAAQFTPAVGSSEHASWLKDLDRIDAALCALFLAVVVSIVAYGVRTCLAARRIDAPSVSELPATAGAVA